MNRLTVPVGARVLYLPRQMSGEIAACHWPGYADAVLFERQKRLLALLDALGGEVGGLDFQKLLFLFCREDEEAPTYEFVPYRFGGFSKGTYIYSESTRR